MWVQSLGWEDPWRRHNNPLQYSCLENPMHRGAWQAIQSIGSQRVIHNWSDLAHTHSFCYFLKLSTDNAPLNSCTQAKGPYHPDFRTSRDVGVPPVTQHACPKSLSAPTASPATSWLVVPRPLSPPAAAAAACRAFPPPQPTLILNATWLPPLCSDLRKCISTRAYGSYQECTRHIPNLAGESAMASLTLPPSEGLLVTRLCAGHPKGLTKCGLTLTQIVYPLIFTKVQDTPSLCFPWQLPRQKREQKSCSHGGSCLCGAQAWKTHQEGPERPSRRWSRLRIHLPMQGAWVWSLIQEYPTGHRTTKPVHQNHWAYVLEVRSCNKRSYHNKKPTYRN